MAARLLAGGHDEVAFAGTPESLEARLVPEAGVAFHSVPARGFDRSRPLSLLVALFVLASGTIRALGLIRKLNPDVVVGFGGYVSIPVGLAAVLTRRPLVLHEQNSVPGLANRFLSRFASSVAVTYQNSSRHLAHPERALVTGNPVRDEILGADRDTARRAMQLDQGEVLLLVFGGSRGARHLNSAVVRHSERILASPVVRVLHVAGPAEVATVRRALEEMHEGKIPERYRLEAYLDDMGSALAAADLVVARAGATSLAEITALGRPAVLVPYPYATDDHQTSNAAGIAEAGGAVVFADSEIDGREFVEAVTGLLGDASARATMSAASRGLGLTNAAERVAQIVRSFSRTTEG